MKKHEFMTRLANALHSPSSVCSASLRSQLPLIGEALGMRGSKASLVRGSLFRCGGAKKTEIVLAFLRGMCYNNNENHY